MPRPPADEQRSAQAKHKPTAPSETELQKQRADWEGMTPNKPQPATTLENEGEGNRTADRSYRRRIERLLRKGHS